MSDPKLRIAIIGGGMGGICVANALFKKPHLDVHVYEAKPEFSERGAAIIVGHHVINALEAIIPSAREVVLAKAGAVAMNASWLMMASGPHAGEKIRQQPAANKSSVVHRAAFLSALMAPLPQDMLHVNKKLASIGTTRGKANVMFCDGTMETFDAVIGADGIWGSVRKHVLQNAAAEHVATPAGFWDCRYLVPYDKAKAKLGAEYFTEHRQHGWCGEGGFILFDPLDNGETVQCIISAVEQGHSYERGRPLTREILETTLKAWLEGPIAKNMIDLVLENPDLKGYSQWEHKSTPTYANGNVCIMGDAAHATTPWQGSGAGMAIEDSAALGALLSEVKTSEDIVIAFQAFDQVRRPRCQRIVDSSNGTGRLMCLQDEAAGADPSSVLALLAPRSDFIRAYDVEEDMAKVVARAKELKMKSDGHEYRI